MPGVISIRVKIYYPLTCPTSVKLLGLLKERGLTDEIELIDVKEHPLSAISKGII